MPDVVPDVIGRWLRARSEADLVTLGGLTDPGAVWESPVHGPVEGREGLIAEVAAAWEDTEAFSTETLALRVHGDRAAAVVRNSGTRDGRTLDSLQTLFITVGDGLVTRVRVAVDDPAAIEAFWGG
ncbi:MAG: nuclear transport factor 2 family protein [Thermoleophilia bacterium]|nr:nuclear transport factor 2 family protein [Thermoleophilia bacterium]